MAKRDLNWQNLNDILESDYSTNLADDYLKSRLLENSFAIDIYHEDIRYFKTPAI